MLRRSDIYLIMFLILFIAWLFSLGAGLYRQAEPRYGFTHGDGCPAWSSET